MKLPAQNFGKEWLALAAILILAAAFRLTNLDGNPPGVFRDEAEKALNGWALSETGQVFEFVPGREPSIKWRSHPLFINVFGVETSAIYQYTLAALMGESDKPPPPWLFRMPAALAGLLTVLALYLVARRIYGVPVAIAAAFWLAVSPWHVVFSRWALQGIFVPLFLTVAMGALLLGAERKPRWLVVSGFFFGLAFYAYSGARPFILAFLVAACGIERDRLFSRERKRWMWAAAGAFAIFAAPTAIRMLAPGGTTRFGNISVFNDRNFIQGLLALFSNYAVHYLPNFLILTGDPNLRHSTRHFGELYHVELFFVLLGMWRMWRDHAPGRQLGAAWLLLFPVGAALTNPAEMPHALRSIVLLPLPQLLAAYGAVWLIQRKWETDPTKSLMGRLGTEIRELVTSPWRKKPDVGDEKQALEILDSIAPIDVAPLDHGFPSPTDLDYSVYEEPETERSEAGVEDGEGRPRRGDANDVVAEPEAVFEALAPASRTRLFVATFLGSAVVASVIGFALDLFNDYPRHAATSAVWETGFGEALEFAREIAGDDPVAISGSVALAPYLTLYYDGIPPQKLQRDGFAGLNAIYLEPPRPPADPFDLRPVYARLPRNCVLIALPYDRVDAYPVKIVHPPASSVAASEQLPATYVVYKKN